MDKNNPCHPERWFLKKDEQFKIELRETGSGAFIQQNQLLEGRFSGWGIQNHPDVYHREKWGEYVYKNWELPEPEKHLLSYYTSENEVVALVHGDEFMGDLYQKLLPSSGAEFVLIAGWQFSMSRFLDGALTFRQTSLLTNTLSTLVSATEPKAQVRLLAFDNPIPGIKNNQMVDWVNESLYPVDKPLTKAAYLESELGGSFISHHQKEVFVGNSDFRKTYAYVGGMDLGVDRWDTAKHDRTTSPEDRFYGWHDIQVRVCGDANTQIWANFAERWDAVNNRISHVVKKMENFRLKPCPVPAWKEHINKGSQHVQVLRTVANAPSSNRSRFMPYGERTVLCALKKAIENAECYIYIEEQFLWDCELADFIRAQMEKKKKLHLIIVMAASTDLPPPTSGVHYHLRSLFFKNVMGVSDKSEISFGSKTRVYAYGLFQRPEALGKPIYVHSKLFIVDDRYVAIGSANVNSRSMHIETELTLGITDETTVKNKLGGGDDVDVCVFAKNLREKLWKELLGVSELHPDPIEALKEFPDRGDDWPKNEKAAKGSTKNFVRCYINQPGADSVAGLRRLLDRNQRQWIHQTPGT